MVNINTFCYINNPSFIILFSLICLSLILYYIVFHYKQIKLIKLEFKANKQNTKYFINSKNKILFSLKLNKIINENFKENNIILKIVKKNKNKSLFSVLKSNNYKSNIEHVLEAYVFIPEKDLVKSNEEIYNNKLLKVLEYLKKNDLNVDYIDNTFENVSNYNLLKKLNYLNMIYLNFNLFKMN